MKLIDNWRAAWRMFSVQAFAGIAALQVVSATAPAGFMALHVPAFTGVTWADLFSYGTFVLTVVGVLGRLVSQAPPGSTG